MALFENLTNVICLTVDVEWVCQEVLLDITHLLDERGLHVTFFCTHEGIKVPGHERALHPNFHRNGSIYRQLREEIGDAISDLTEKEIYQYAIKNTHKFCPEAIGVRAHNSYFNFDVLSVYREAGLQYDSTYSLPLASGLQPILKEFGILEMPIYYMDHIDLINQMTGFSMEKLCLKKPSLKVFDFHPNIVFLNASTEQQYLESKPCYHDYEQLLHLRHKGRGVRTLFIDLLDYICAEGHPTMTLGELNRVWRETHKIK